MRITVRVKPHARRNLVEESGENDFVVHVTAPPVDGKANERVVALLAAHFGKPKSAITIIRGASARRKIIEIGE